MYSRHSDPCLRHSSCIYCCTTYTHSNTLLGSARASERASDGYTVIADSHEHEGGNHNMHLLLPTSLTPSLSPNSRLQG